MSRSPDPQQQHGRQLRGCVRVARARPGLRPRARVRVARRAAVPRPHGRARGGGGVALRLQLQHRLAAAPRLRALGHLHVGVPVDGVSERLLDRDYFVTFGIGVCNQKCPDLVR